MSEIYTVNIKQNMPGCYEAMEQLHIEIMLAKNSDCGLLKIVHGYGSHGLGGRIRESAHRLLREYKKSGVITAFCPGEQWNPFDPDARRIVAAFPFAAKDEDFAHDNVGITVIWCDAR